ncbi:hypothetical protein EFP44_08270 [Lacticaseibacillus paracasei]|nr:hypothetical protein [Lacticaseibacillus paracasei]
MDAVVSKTRSQTQKPAHKDLKPKWLKPNHLGLRPLMFRFLTGLARALASVFCRAILIGTFN